MSVSNNFDFSLILENSKSSILDFKLNTAFKPLLHMCSAACFRLPLYDIKITRDDEYKNNSMSRFKYFHTRLESSTFILTEYFYNIAKKKEKKKIMIIHQDLLDRCEAGNHPFRYFSL